MWVFAVVAQLVEQHIRNVKVASSIPANGTKFHQKTRPLAKVGGFFVVRYFSALADGINFHWNQAAKQNTVRRVAGMPSLQTTILHRLSYERNFSHA